MHSVLPPGPRAAVLEAAEEASAIFTLQTLVRKVIVLVVRDQAVHLQQGRPGTDVQHAGGLVVLCLVGLGLLALPVAGEVVQSAILHQGGEGEDEADRDEQVHGRDVGDLGEGLPGDGAQGGHGEHRGDAWKQSNHLLCSSDIEEQRIIYSYFK